MIAGSDKYRFYVCTDGVNFARIRTTKPVLISGAKKENSVALRRTTSEWKFVRYENVAVYDAIITKIASPSTATTGITCKIELWDDWQSLTSIEYEGYVPIGGLKVDADSGIIIFTPEDNSDYVWWDENKDVKKDLVSTANRALHSNTVTIDDTSVSQDYWLPVLENTSFNNLVWMDSSASGIGDVVKWTFDPNPNPINPTYYKSDEDAGAQWRLGGWVWDKPTAGGTLAIVYYYCKKTHIPNLTNRPATGSQGHIYWDHYDALPYLNYVFHGRQQRSRFNLPGFLRGDGVYQPMFIGATADPTVGTNCPSDRFYYAGITPISGTATISTHGNIKLAAAFNYLLTGSGLTFSSDFFTNATNPVTTAASKISNLFISQKTYVKNIDEIETTGEISLNELITDLCKYFPCMWDIDSVNHLFIIEHIKYFANGKRYTPGTPGIYTDLTVSGDYPIKYQVVTDADGQKSDNEFSYDFKPPQKEKYTPFDTLDTWSEILYTSAFTNKGVTDEITPAILSTDILFVVDYPAESSDDGFLLIATDSSNNIHRRTFVHRERVNTLFTNYPNGDLMYINLIRDFWVYGRYFLTGIINNDITATTFTSQNKTKCQRDIRFPRLGAGAFDPTKLITTNIGNGEVKTFEVNTDTDYIKVSLLYAMQ